MEKESVTLATVRLTISRKTGKVIAEKVVDQREIPAADYGDMMVQFITGKSTEQVYQELREAIADEQDAD